MEFSHRFVLRVSAQTTQNANFLSLNVNLKSTTTTNCKRKNKDKNQQPYINGTKLAPNLYTKKTKYQKGKSKKLEVCKCAKLERDDEMSDIF